MNATAQWAAQWAAGWSYRRIAAQAGVSDATVRRALVGQIARRPPGPVPRSRPTIEQTVEAYLRLGSIRAVERELGVSETYIRARLFAAGLIDRHPDQRRRSG